MLALFLISLLLLGGFWAYGVRAVLRSTTRNVTPAVLALSLLLVAFAVAEGAYVFAVA